jgi:hypothetical protein
LRWNHSIPKIGQKASKNQRSPRYSTRFLDGECYDSSGVDSISIDGVDKPWLLPNDDVQNDKIKQVTKKVPATYPVNFFNTSAVDVPNRESPESPPKEAPRPKLFAS